MSAFPYLANSTYMCADGEVGQKFVDYAIPPVDLQAYCDALFAFLQDDGVVNLHGNVLTVTISLGIKIVKKEAPIATLEDCKKFTDEVPTAT